MKVMLELDPMTADWLAREAAASARDASVFVGEILRELADPDAVEGDLIDRLLAEAAHAFPPIMEFDEHADMREEVLDHLCHRLSTVYRATQGTELTAAEKAKFRARLEERADSVWS